MVDYGNMDKDSKARVPKKCIMPINFIYSIDDYYPLNYFMIIDPLHHLLNFQLMHLVLNMKTLKSHLKMKYNEMNLYKTSDNLDK